MGTENEIVFEDLHGVNEDEPVTIDLDVALKDDGISRTPAGHAADVDTGDDDDIQIDNLRGAQDDDEESESAPQQVVDKDDASKGNEDDDYSKKVQARIRREQRAKAKERERGDYWENQAKKLAKDSYERDKAAAERVIEQADGLIEDTQAQLETAIEEGKTKDQVRLTALLTDQKAAKIQARVSLDNLSPDGNVQPFSGKVGTDSSTPQKESAKWVDGHSDWYQQKGFERQTRLANRIDKEVFADGYDPDSPEYFEELDRRIKEKEPSLYDDLDAADVAPRKEDTRRGKPQSVVAPVGGNENSRQRSSSSNKVELTEEDFANMRRFNLNTNDPEVLKEYARNKREAEQGARR